MGNLFLINAEGYKEYLLIFTTALNSKPETIIMNYEERFSIEVTIKELKSYLCIESNYFEGKESNYGYLFILCLAIISSNTGGYISLICASKTL
jgi:hypothetical protein